MNYRWSRISVLDVDLTCPGVRIEVAAEDATERYSGCSDGRARTVADWCRATGALAGLNGGFFGRDMGEGRKEIVGLLKMDGQQYARAPRYWDDGGTGGRGDSRKRQTRGQGDGAGNLQLQIDNSQLQIAPSPRRRERSVAYAHSALGFDPEGRPAIDWVISDPRQPTRLLAFGQAEVPGDRGSGLPDSPQSWPVRSALSGGPRLISRGRVAVADGAERLTSPGFLPRTFVGYAYAAQDGATSDVGSPRRLVAPPPRYVVMGVATSMTFGDVARFLDGYFRRYHGVPCAEAMALDGGPSSQLAYRADGVLYEAQTSDVTVPTCLLIHGDEPAAEAALP